MENSIQTILMLKNTVNSNVGYIMLQFKIAVFCASFSASFLQSSVSHDPSEIILMC